MSHIPATSPCPGERFHALDALRAAALLLGVVFHSLLAYVMPPGEWGVGTTSPSLPIWWLVHYSHNFRMPLFFMLAGFFACLTIESDAIALRIAAVACQQF